MLLSPLGVSCETAAWVSRRFPCTKWPPGKIIKAPDTVSRRFVLRAKDTGKKMWKQRTRRTVANDCPGAVSPTLPPAPRGCHGHSEGYGDAVKGKLSLLPSALSSPTTAAGGPHFFPLSASNTLLLSHVGCADLCSPTSTSIPAVETQLSKVTSAQVQCPSPSSSSLTSHQHWAL